MTIKSNMLKDKRIAIIVAIFCSILWGSAFPVLKTGYRLFNISPDNITGKIVFAGARFFIASVIIFIFARFVLKIKSKPSKKQLAMIGVLGILQTTLQYSLFYVGLAYTTGMKGSIINSMSTFFVIILSHFVFMNDKINRKKIIGLILAMVGIVIINYDPNEISFVFSIRGEGFMLISTVIAACGTVLAKILSKEVNPFYITSIQMFFGSLILLGLGLPGSGWNVINITTWGTVLLIYSSLLSAVAFSLWYYLLKYYKAGEISMYKFVIPVTGTILSSIFLPGESLSLNIAIALAVIISAIIIVNK